MTRSPSLSPLMSGFWKLGIATCFSCTSSHASYSSGDRSRIAVCSGPVRLPSSSATYCAYSSSLRASGRPGIERPALRIRKRHTESQNSALLRSSSPSSYSLAILAVNAESLAHLTYDSVSSWTGHDAAWAAPKRSVLDGPASADTHAMSGPSDGVPAMRLRGHYWMIAILAITRIAPFHPCFPTAILVRALHLDILAHPRHRRTSFFFAL